MYLFFLGYFQTHKMGDDTEIRAEIQIQISINDSRTVAILYFLTGNHLFCSALVVG